MQLFLIIFFLLHCKQARNPGDHFNLICTGMCGHTIGKLTHPQTEAGLSINKNRPILRLCTIKRESKLAKLQQILFNFMKTTHSQVELVTSIKVLCIRIMIDPQVFGQKFTPICRFLRLENSLILAAHPWYDPKWECPPGT